MQVLLCCGSYSPDGSNRRVLMALCERLSQVDVVWSPDLDQLPILRSDQLSQPPPSVLALRESVASADAIVLAGPEYGGGLAGGLKNALDWCVGAEHGFYGKPVAVLAVSASGGRNAQVQLAQTLLWQGAHLVGTAAFPSALVPRGAWATQVEEELDGLSADLTHWVGQPEDARTERAMEMADSLGIFEYPHRPPKN